MFKGHMPRSKVIRGPVIRLDQIGTKCFCKIKEPSHPHEVKGHVRSICEIA